MKTFKEFIKEENAKIIEVMGEAIFFEEKLFFAEEVVEMVERWQKLQQCSVSRRSETIKNFGKILDIMNRYKQEVDNGIYDHKEAMIEEIIARFTIVSNGS